VPGGSLAIPGGVRPEDVVRYPFHLVPEARLRAGETQENGLVPADPRAPAMEPAGETIPEH